MAALSLQIAVMGPQSAEDLKRNLGAFQKDVLSLSEQERDIVRTGRSILKKTVEIALGSTSPIVKDLVGAIDGWTEQSDRTLDLQIEYWGAELTRLIHEKQAKEHLDETASDIILQLSNVLAATKDELVRRLTGSTPRPARLVDRLTTAQWDQLELAARQAAFAAGVESMHAFRNGLEVIAGPARQLYNPSTTADIGATAAALTTFEAFAHEVASDFRIDLRFLGEETAFTEQRLELQKRISRRANSSIVHHREFFSPETAIGIIVDGIDGTSNFVRGIPMYCSAIAVLIEQEPRVAAIFDPTQQVVYYASLRGKGERSAARWQLGGMPSPLPEPVHVADAARSLTVHFSRTDPSTAERTRIHMGRLAPDFPGGIYALNSGLLALTYIARGSVSAFFNLSTNLWDVAAGQVLIEATGGRVCQVSGQPLTYGAGDPKCSVVAGGLGFDPTDLIEKLRLPE